MSHLSLRGLRTHGLQSLDLDLPHHRLTVLTGVSGSGKSSLAFDTLYMEAVRRYAETLPYTLRRHLRLPPRPPYDHISGLCPAIGLSQRGNTGHGPRATVGNLSEVIQPLRELWVKEGQLHCTQCNTPIEVLAPDRITQRLQQLPEGQRLTLMARVLRAQKTGVKKVIDELIRSGFTRVRLDGQHILADEIGVLDSRIPHDLDVIVDRIRSGPDKHERLSESVEAALKAGKGSIIVEIDGKEQRFTGRWICPECQTVLHPPSTARLAYETVSGWCPACKGLGCSTCDHSRLAPEGQRLRWKGLSLPEACSLPLHTLLGHLAAHPDPFGLSTEASRRLNFLCRAGLAYLSLNRSAESLSAGELQRIRLSARVGDGLSGILYILDEPTAGLHPDETQALITLIKELVTAGSTVIVVEHDPAMIAAADHVVDIGPGPGAAGGRICYQGPPAGLWQADCPTGHWLSGKEHIEMRSPPPTTRYLELLGATGRGLNLDLKIPIGQITGIEGRSGSGKRSLILETLAPALQKHLRIQGPTPLPYRELRGAEAIQRLVWADPGAVGRSPLASVATLSGLWQGIRQLLAQSAEAKRRGFGPERFGFHAGGGRCSQCKGAGVRIEHLSLMPTVYLPCEVCEGKRFDAATLEVRWRGHSAADILLMTLKEARKIFGVHPRLRPLLDRLVELGLGYLPLGQRGDSLSGGERQRLRLCKELGSSSLPQSLYLLHEPSVGLHPADMARLLACLRGLSNGGATVLVLDHDPLLLSGCDQRIRLGN